MAYYAGPFVEARSKTIICAALHYFHGFEVLQRALEEFSAAGSLVFVYKGGQRLSSVDGASAHSWVMYASFDNRIVTWALLGKRHAGKHERCYSKN
jgi:hypothetical protein